MKNLIFLFLFLPVIAEAKAPFLGAIPVQYVAPGEEAVIDAHRFFQPGDNEKLEFSPNNDVDLSFDAATFQLRAKAKRPGLFDIVLHEWVRIFGDSLFAMRAMSAALGTLAIVLLFIAVRESGRQLDTNGRPRLAATIIPRS